LAAQHESPDCLQVLLDFGVDVNKPERRFGSTPLIESIVGGSVECMQMLLEKNADVNQQNSTGFNGLHVACHNEHAECLRLLIDNKADVQLQDRDGKQDSYWLRRLGNSNAWS
jgi:ankyrin repeat protein